MCLSIIHRIPAPKSGWGWKRFGKNQRGRDSFMIMGGEVRKGVWLKAITTRTITTTTGKPYKSGFHIWLELPKRIFDTKSFTYKRTTPELAVANGYCKVRFRGGRVLGQNNGLTVIADKMFVPRKWVKK